MEQYSYATFPGKSLNNDISDSFVFYSHPNIYIYIFNIYTQKIIIIIIIICVYLIFSFSVFYIIYHCYLFAENWADACNYY